MGKYFLKRTHQNGFTIVELLIVVVVIAILAAITVVAYSGIQGRAKHTALISAVDAWTKTIQIAKINDGAYPASYTSVPGIVFNTKHNVAYGCLGAPGALPADGNFPADSCWIISTDGGATYSVVASMLNDSTAQQLVSHTTHPPAALPGGIVRIGSGTPEDPFYEIRGILYVSNGSLSPGQASILYYYQGSYDCPRGQQSTEVIGSITLSACSVTLR